MVLEAIVPLDRCLLLDYALRTLEWSLHRPPPNVGKKRKMDPAEAETYLKECVANNRLQHLETSTERGLLVLQAAGYSNVRGFISVNNYQSASGRRRLLNLQDSSPNVMAVHSVT